MVMTDRLRIAIIGGGLAGAAIANSLIHYPHLDIHVFESAPEFSERGAAIGLSVNALKALEQVVPDSEALLEKAGAVEMNSSRIMIGSGPQAGTLVFDLAGLEPVRGRVVHRASLLRGLLAPLPNDVLHVKKRLAAIVPHADESVTLRFEDGKKESFDAVIGADGIFSFVRDHVVGTEHSATPAGYWDCRNLVSMKRAQAVLGGKFFELDRQYGWLGDGAFIMHDILESRSMVQIVISAVESTPSKERKIRLSQEHLQETLRKWPDEPIAKGAIQLMLEGQEDCAYAWSQWEHKTTPSYARGNVCIVGDAAHATTPWQGSGAGQALEDAMILGTLFQDVTTRQDVRHVFKAFDVVRRPRAQQVIDSSQGTGAIMCGQSHTLGLDAQMLAEGMAPRWAFIMGLDMNEHKREAIEKLHELKKA